jgi:GNAT superfamily N-acetyltransferase
MTYKLIQNFKKDDGLRKKFNDLAISTFKLDFEPWYQNGYWTEAYRPFSFIYQDQMVSNASANIMKLNILGQPVNAIQIGTVMTHPDHRKKGLAKKLIETIIDNYQSSNDLIYLFGDTDAIGFYEKLGFKKVKETTFKTLYTNDSEPLELRHLDMTNPEDKDLFDVISSHQIPLSSDFMVYAKQSLSGFYGTLVLANHLYYDQVHKCIYAFKRNENYLDLFDIIQTQATSLDVHLSRLVKARETVHFHFTPGPLSTPVETDVLITDGELMVYDHTINFPDKFLFPMTSHA